MFGIRQLRCPSGIVAKRTCYLFAGGVRGIPACHTIIGSSSGWLPYCAIRGAKPRHQCRPGQRRTGPRPNEHSARGLAHKSLLWFTQPQCCCQVSGVLLLHWRLHHDARPQAGSMAQAVAENVKAARRPPSSRRRSGSRASSARRRATRQSSCTAAPADTPAPARSGDFDVLMLCALHTCTGTPAAGSGAAAAAACYSTGSLHQAQPEQGSRLSRWPRMGAGSCELVPVAYQIVIAKNCKRLTPSSTDHFNGHSDF